MGSACAEGHFSPNSQYCTVEAELFLCASRYPRRSPFAFFWKDIAVLHCHLPFELCNHILLRQQWGLHTLGLWAKMWPAMQHDVAESFYYRTRELENWKGPQRLLNPIPCQCSKSTHKTKAFWTKWTTQPLFRNIEVKRLHYHRRKSIPVQDSSPFPECSILLTLLLYSPSKIAVTAAILGGWACSVLTGIQIYCTQCRLGCNTPNPEILNVLMVDFLKMPLEWWLP